MTRARKAAARSKGGRGPGSGCELRSTNRDERRVLPSLPSVDGIMDARSPAWEARGKRRRRRRRAGWNGLPTPSCRRYGAVANAVVSPCAGARAGMLDRRQAASVGRVAEGERVAPHSSQLREQSLNRVHPPRTLFRSMAGEPWQCRCPAQSAPVLVRPGRQPLCQEVERRGVAAVREP